MSAQTTMNPKTSMYLDWVAQKIIHTPKTGFDVPAGDIHPYLKPHQADSIKFAGEGGNRAVFNSFGLGKTAIQLWLGHLCIKHTGKSFIQGLPLGVVPEFVEEAGHMGLTVYYVTCQSEVLAIELETGSPQIFLSNYERIREGNFTPEHFGGSSLDEGDAIRNLDTETTDYMMTEFTKIPIRYIATATPCPNDYTEILNYAQYLGVMDRGQALTRFFKRNPKKAADLTLYDHKVDEFWLWFRSWSITIQFPSDLGYSDEGYILPELTVNYHEVKPGERSLLVDRDGNIKLYADEVKGMPASSREKRDSLLCRVDKAMEIVGESPDDHFLIWHDLEDERIEIEKRLPEAKSVFGKQSREKKEELLIGFKKGEFKYLPTKPTIAGSGCNFQHHCHRAIFTGIGYKFKDFIQAIHRIYRFMQKHKVIIDIIHTDAEREILKELLRKWRDHDAMVAKQTALIRKYGLHGSNANSELLRTIGVDRKEVCGRNFTCIHNDCVIEAQNMADNSVDMILTSIPFSDQYEYCESYHDMGHNNGNDEFFKQLGWLTPELLRILKPGRDACIHVKDRIQFSYQNGAGFTSLIDFSGQTVKHFLDHGFFLMGKHFIPTDVATENNQNYRLGWTENCKDGSKMGCGSPEYLLVFRKAPTDKQNAYADERVVKSKDTYSRGRWQLDAHAMWLTNGNRLFNPEELRKLDLKQIGKLWKEYSLNNPYDFDTHVKVAETLDGIKKLPSKFMAVPTHCNNQWVWDVNRMNTLNASQAIKKKELHVCPLQFDIIDRAIVRYSNENDLVFDPFGGIMSVPYRCLLKLKRQAIATELNEAYWKDGYKYCQEAELKNNVPTLFDALATTEDAA